MILLAFDVDGTLDTSAGPVPFDLLLKRISYDVAQAVVSPSGAWPKDKFPMLNFATGDRVADLKRFAGQYPDAVVRLYVSDNKDYDVAHAAGFCYIEAAEFARGVLRMS